MEFDLNRRPFLSFLKIQYFLLHMLLITLLGKKCFVAFFLIARIGLWLLVKGQLISKCPFGVKTSSKIPTKLFLDFCPEIFCSFLGGFLEAFWPSWGLSK